MVTDDKESGAAREQEEESNEDLVSESRAEGSPQGNREMETAEEALEAPTVSPSSLVTSVEVGQGDEPNDVDNVSSAEKRLSGDQDSRMFEQANPESDHDSLRRSQPSTSQGSVALDANAQPLTENEPSILNVSVEQLQESAVIMVMADIQDQQSDRVASNQEQSSRISQMSKSSERSASHEKDRADENAIAG